MDRNESLNRFKKLAADLLANENNRAQSGRIVVVAQSWSRGDQILTTFIGSLFEIVLLIILDLLAYCGPGENQLIDTVAKLSRKIEKWTDLAFVDENLENVGFGGGADAS
jgi:hypothetical protein